MEFVDLRKIVRKDSPIHYINEYHGEIICNIDGIITNHQIEIILEKTAMGNTNIQVHLNNDAAEELLNSKDLLIEFVNGKYKDGYFKE
ncbi:MAG: hypothetical protein JEZ04_00640 [Spirochaetales bacterium]|nr:hypothetical protein [Spirochaetales bacterium]